MPCKKRKQCKHLVPCKQCGCKLYPDCRVFDDDGDVMLCEECVNGADGSHKKGIGPAAGENVTEKRHKKED